MTKLSAALRHHRFGLLDVLTSGEAFSPDKMRSLHAAMARMEQQAEELELRIAQMKQAQAAE